MLTSCCQLADIMMRLHGVRQLVDEKSVASCQQTCWKLRLFSSYAFFTRTYTHVKVKSKSISILNLE